MDDIDKQILELVNEKGKSASQMTHALKFIGNGDMCTGLEKVKDYFTREGKKIGEVTGCVKGIVFTSLIFAIGVLIKKEIERNSRREEEGETLLKELEEELSNDSDELKNKVISEL